MQIVKRAKSCEVVFQEELAVIGRVEPLLQDRQKIFGRSFSDAELKFLRDGQLFTTKPVSFLANVSLGTGLEDVNVGKANELAKPRGTKTIVLCGKLSRKLRCYQRKNTRIFFQN